MKKERKKLVWAFLWLVLPTLIVAGVMVVLLHWHIPTRIEANLTVNRVVFTVRGTERTQILNQVPFQKVVVEEFSTITLSQPEQLEVAVSVKDSQNREDSFLNFSALQPTSALDIQGSVHPYLKSSVTFKVADSDKEAFLGFLDPLTVESDSQVTLFLREKQVTDIVLRIDERRSSVTLRIEDVFQFEPEFSELPEILERFSNKELSIYRAKFPASQKRISITGTTKDLPVQPNNPPKKSHSLQLSLTIPPESTSSEFFYSGGIPVKTLDFRPYPVEYVEIKYPRYPDIEKVVFETSEVKLENLEEFSIKNIHLNPELRGIDLELEGIAGEVEAKSFGFSKDCRLTHFDDLWHNPLLMVLLAVIVWGAPTLAGVYKLYQEIVTPFKREISGLQKKIDTVLLLFPRKNPYLNLNLSKFSDDPGRLIREPSENVVIWEDTAVESVLERSQQDLHEVQTLCSALINYALKNNIFRIDDNVLKNFLEQYQRQDEFDVFLAHNSEDKPQVEAVGKALKNYGVNFWIDEEQIPPGRWFQDVIQRAITNVKSVAVFIGPHGLGKWQIVEIRAFISRCVDEDIPVIPILLPGVKEFPVDLLVLKELNWVRFTKSIDKDTEALEKLVWGITGKHPQKKANK